MIKIYKVTSYSKKTGKAVLRAVVAAEDTDEVMDIMRQEGLLDCCDEEEGTEENIDLLGIGADGLEADLILEDYYIPDMDADDDKGDCGFE